MAKRPLSLSKQQYKHIRPMHNQMTRISFTRED